MHIPLILRCGLALAASSSAALAQWQQFAIAPSPTARVGAAMDYVPLNGGLLLFGGSAPLINNETWTFDGFAWTQLAPAVSPTARSGAQLVHDSNRGVAVLYGGLASNISIPPPTNQTWEWNGATWAQVTPAANPGNRYLYGACYDSVRSRVVMYGGATTQLISVPNSQTWEYDGTTWVQVTTTGNPGPRERPAMCFHQGLGKAVMFGGGNGSGVTDQTWLYDGVAGTWQQVAMAGVKPPGRNAATLSYDAVRGLCVLTGGQDANGVLADTWTFDGASWTQQPTTTTGVRDHMAAFLPNLAQVVKFGGFVTGPFVLTNETWGMGSGVFGQGCAGSNGTPSLAASSAPRTGQPWTLNMGNLAPAFSAAILAFGFFQLPGIDLGIIDMPGCSAFTFADITIVANGIGGSASWTWSSVTGGIGDVFFGQAYCLDPGITPLGFTVSNAVYVTLSY